MLGKLDKMLLHQSVSSISTEIAANLKMPIYEIEKWLTQCCEKLHTIYIDYGQVVFAFIIQMQAHDMLDLTSESINQLKKSHQEVGVLNKNLSISVSSELKSADQIEIGNYGEKNELIILRFNGELLEFFIKGLYKHRINLMHPESTSEIRMGMDARCCRDYKLAIEDHSRKRLIFVMDKYWANKKDRILISSKNKRTESIFQEELFDWLKSHLYDGVPSIEVKTNAGDRTDIDIRGYECGQHYIIEIKWLGKNENGSTYNKDRIVAGIGQICTYLKRDLSLNEACLVCYDGRTEEKHNAESSIDKRLVPPKGDYKIIFLESESASKKGEAYANQS